MPDFKIKLKTSNSSGSVPSTSDLVLGELAVNSYDGKLFLKQDNGTVSVIEVGKGTNLSWDASTRTISSDSGNNAVITNVTQSASGLMSSTDKSKLDNIAAGAEVNVATNLSYVANSREIQSSTGTNTTLPEVVASGASGLLSGSDKTKLDGIATGAQVNVSTDLSYTNSTRLLESSTGTDVTLPLVVSSGIAGMMSGTDKAKLDSIESNAQINIQSDFNATSGDALILNKPSIPADIGDLDNVNNATPTDGQVLTWDNSNSYWAPSTSTLTGAQSFSNTTASTATLNISNSGGQGTGTGTGAILLNLVGDSDALVFKNISTGDYGIYNSQQNNGIEILDAAGGLRFLYDGVERLRFAVGTGYNVSGDFSGTPSVNSSVIWHAGNDGSGSGLDADLLDGFNSASAATADTIVKRTNAGDVQCRLVRPNYTDQSSISGAIAYRVENGTNNYIRFCNDKGNIRSFLNVLRSDASDTLSGNLTVNRLLLGGSSNGGFDYNSTADTLEILTTNGSTHSEFNANAFVPASNNTKNLGANALRWATVHANSVKIDGDTAWHAGNDGAASGLDADLLDGQQGSYYLDYNNLTNIPAGGGTNADTVDNLHASSFLRSDADDVTGSGVKTRFGGVINSSSSATVQVDGFMRTCSIFIHQGGTGSATESNGVELTNTSGGLLWGGSTIWHSGNDGSGSGLDADTVDGIEGGNFVRSDASDTMNGSYTINSSTDQKLILQGSSAPYIRFRSGTTNAAYLQYDTSSASIYLWNTGAGTGFRMTSTTPQFYDGMGYQSIWHAGNDGASSGLDADTLDGIEASSFLRSDANDLMNAQLSGGMGAVTTGGTTDWNDSTNARSGNGYTLLTGNASNGPGGGTYYHPFSFEYASKNGNGNMTQFAIPYNGASPHFRYRYSSTWSSWYQTWNSGNDGSGSGLDADTLDGLQLGTGRNDTANQVVRTNSSGYIDAGWINTTSGNNTTNTPDRFYGSSDGYIRYYDRAYTQMYLGNTYKYTTSRRQHTTDSNYWVGTMGWGTVDFNTLFHYGSGHIDTWSNPGNQPSGTSHWVGNQSLHYSNGTVAYGHQFVVGAGNPSLCYIRGWWGGSPTGWAKMWNANNDGSGSGLDADTVDGAHASSFVEKSGSSTTISTPCKFTAGSGAGGSGTTSGFLIESNSQYMLAMKHTSSGVGPRITMWEGGNSTFKADIGWSGSGYIYLDNNEQDRTLRIGSTLNFLHGGTSYTVWYSGNDGSGSGLDADTVHGSSPSSLLVGKATTLDPGSAYQTSMSDTASSRTFGMEIDFVQSAQGWPSYGTVVTAKSYSGGGGTFQLYNGYGSGYGGNNLRYRTADYSAGSSNPPWTSFRQIWDAGNDGAGSGLDADTVKGANAHLQGTSIYGYYTGSFTPGAGNSIEGNVLRSSSISYFSKSQGVAININRNNNGDCVSINYGGVEKGSIEVRSTRTYFRTTSDHRLKSNVMPIADAIDVIKDLKPSQYNWIDGGSLDYGFLAHEIQPIIPGAASGEKDEVDENGDPVYQKVDQATVIPFLTAALKEAIARIEVLETQAAIS